MKGAAETFKVDYMNIQQHRHERSDTKSKGFQASPDVHTGSLAIPSKEVITVFSPKIMNEGASRKASCDQSGQLCEILSDGRTAGVY